MFYLLLTLILSFLALSYQQQLIKLKPIFVNEEETHHQILVQFNASSQFKRLQLMATTTNGNSNSTVNLFYINNTQLTLNLGGKLDREHLINEKQCETQDNLDCVFRIRIAAYDGSNSMVAIYIIPIMVLDSNDNKPQFRHTIYRLNISENLLQATQIPLDAPVDHDSAENGIRECQIENNTNLKQFEAFYNRETHRLHLLIKQSLDRENTSQYDLIVKCSDGLNFARTKLHIDVLDANDNVPYFKQNVTTVNIEENSASSFVHLQAEDKDDSSHPNGQLVYSLPFELNSNEVINELFHIDEVNGTLSIRATAQLDYEKHSKYALKVKVQDKGPNSVSAYSDVHINLIDINDNPPQGHLTFVEKYLMKQDKLNDTIWIYEEQKLLTTLGYLTVSDADTANANGHVLSAELLDNHSLFKLVPIIKEYENLYYSLQVIGRLDRDNTSNSFYDLTFKLSDKVKTSYLKLRIILLDINDNSPVFQKEILTFNLRENQLHSDLTQIKAIDLDLENNLTYSLLTSSAYLPFIINSSTGSLSLTKQLDRETVSKYEFKVKCSDTQGQSGETKVVVNVLDENDELPKFVNWSAKGFEIDWDEEQTAGSVITQVKAIDMDLNSSIFYFMRPDTMNNYFTINNSTGNLISKIKLDAERDPARFVFDVIAVDLLLNLGDQLAQPLPEQKLRIKINLNDINDNKPVIVNKFNYTTLQMNASNNELIVTSFQSNDSDRDFFSSNKKSIANRHFFRIGTVKHIGWNRLFLIISYMPQNHSQLFEPVSRDQVNLKEIFALKMSNETNKADLLLKNCKEIKSGLYLFQIQVVDRSMGALQKNFSLKKKQFWKTEFIFKMFFFNSSSIEQFEQINNIFDKWWQTQTLKEQQKFLDEEEKEEYLHLNSNISMVQHQQFNLKKYLLSNSSDWIIYLISFFIFVSLVLITIISYKHYKASIGHNRNNDSTASTDETNATNSPQQKSKSLTVLSIDSCKEEAEERPEQSPSSSFFESYNQTNTADDDQSKEETKQNSDTSFTVITTIETNRISPSKKSIVMKTVPGYSQANYKQLQQSSSFLSTFQVKQLHEHEQVIAIIEHDDEDEESLVKAVVNAANAASTTTNTSDMGYYSSHLNSSSECSSLKSKMVKPVQYRQQQHRPAKYVNNTSSLSNSITSTNSTSVSLAAAAASAAVINSASALSSPLFRQQQHQQQPTITNLYPPYAFSNNVNNDSVRVYLERFERIYNSPPPPSPLATQQDSSKHGSTATSYSYV